MNIALYVSAGPIMPGALVMTAMDWLLIASGAAVIIALASAAILTVTGGGRLRRQREQAQPHDERGPGDPAIDAFLARLAERNGRRRP